MCSAARLHAAVFVKHYCIASLHISLARTCPGTRHTSAMQLHCPMLSIAFWLGAHGHAITPIPYQGYKHLTFSLSKQLKDACLQHEQAFQSKPSLSPKKQTPSPVTVASTALRGQPCTHALVLALEAKSIGGVPGLAVHGLGAAGKQGTRGLDCGLVWSITAHCKPSHLSHLSGRLSDFECDVLHIREHLS